MEGWPLNSLFYCTRAVPTSICRCYYMLRVVTWRVRAECTWPTAPRSRGALWAWQHGCDLSLMCGNKQKRLTKRHCSMNPVKPTLWWRKWFCAPTVLSEKLCELTMLWKMVFPGDGSVAEELHSAAGAKIFITTRRNLFRTQKTDLIRNQMGFIRISFQKSEMKSHTPTWVHFYGECLEMEVLELQQQYGVHQQSIGCGWKMPRTRRVVKLPDSDWLKKKAV